MRPVPDSVHRTLVTLLIALMAASTAGAAELRLSGAELSAVVENAFAGTSIRLHQSIGPDDSLKSDSFMQFGPRLGRQRFSMEIPPTTVDLALGAEAMFIINDVRIATATPLLKPIAVRSNREAYLLTILFEDAGTEIKGFPAGRIDRLTDTAIPDVEIDRMQLQIVLQPDRSARDVRFLPSKVFFSGDIQLRGLGAFEMFGRRIDLLEPLTDYRDLIKSSVEREVKKRVDASLPMIANAVRAEVQKRAAAYGFRVVSVRFEGSSLVVTGAPKL